MLRQQLQQLLLKQSVRTGQFTLASGKSSDLYIDCRTTAMHPIGANLIGNYGWQFVQQQILTKFPAICAIGGMTLGADPISLAIGIYSGQQDERAPLNIFTVRKEAKSHGRNKRIEGNFQNGDEVIVVDDVITTGGSTIKAIEAIQTEGGAVRAALVLVDREEGGRQAIEELGIPVFSLFTRSDLLAAQ